MNSVSRWRWWGATAGVILLAMTSSPAQGVTPAAEVGEMRAKFTASLQALEQSDATRRAQWRDDYTRALAAARRQLQAAGREGELAGLDTEVTRAARAAAPEVVPVAEASPELAALQREATQRLVTLQRQRFEDILALAGKYTAVLDARERKYAAANDTDRAVAIRAERERALQEPAVTLADFELAILEMDAVASVPAPEKTEVEADGAAPGDFATDTGNGTPPGEHPARNDMARASRARVYSEGKKPPAQDAAAYKKLALNRTDYGPIASPLVVAALSLTKSETQREGAQGRWEQILDRMQLRLVLRTTPAAGALENPIVVVQFFNKNAQAQGRVAPELASVERVDLPRLTTETTTIDFPAQETMLTRQRSGQGGVWESNGKELYGAIISVFSSDEKVLHQSTTIRGLNSHAKSEVPGPALREQMERARQEMDDAHAAENEARLLFFANQRIEANKQAFVEATQRYEAAKQNVEALEAEWRRQRGRDW